jgi:hypothetical protein
MGQTPTFGFELLPDGDMVFGKDLNQVLLNVDEKLAEAIGVDKLQDEGFVTGLDATALGADDVYEEIALDSARDLGFARQVDLSKVRAIFAKTGGTTGTLSLSVAKAGGIAELTADMDYTDSGDQSEDPAAATRVDADETLILIAKRDTGCDLVGNVQIIVEGDVVAAHE